MSDYTPTVSAFVDALPVGRANAMTGKRLAAAFGTDDRTLRALAHEAIEAGYLVVADNAGYYRPESASEADEAIGRLESQGRQMLDRARRTRALLYRVFHPEQGTLDL